MSIFKQQKPQPKVQATLAEPAPEGDVFVQDGGPPRPKQPKAGGETQDYVIAGIMVDGKFVRPGRYELQMEGHDKAYHLGDTVALTAIEHAVVSKRSVLIPPEAIASL